MRRFSIGSVFFCLLVARAGAAGPPAPVLRALAAERVPAAAASFLVMEAGSGRVILAHNAEAARSPASTLKVLTTMAALDELGPAYTWHTRALIRGELDAGDLDGDLVLQGGGDPYLTLERWWSFVHRLRATGLKSIRGDIIVDETAFSLPPEDPGSFDGRPNRSYNVVPAALTVNFQSVDFRVAPNAAARRIDVLADPDPSNLVVDNRIRFVDGRCSASANRVDFAVTSAAWDHVSFTGRLSPRCLPKEFSRVLLTPASYAYGTFLSFWRQEGGEFHGRLRVEPTPAGAQLLLGFDSISLAEIVRLTNKYSNNMMARHLLLAIGQERFGPPATPEKGVAALAEWGRQHGVALDDAKIENGSGLSRAERISAAALGAALRAGWQGRYQPEFVASLPLGGIDGTLRTRLQGTPPGAVRLKTGHLDGVSAVAGFVTGASGKSYVLVSLINHPRVDFGAGEPVHAALVQWVLDEL